MTADSIWLRCITAAKLVGLVLLGVYFYRVPIYVEWTWVAAYVGIMLAMAVIYALLVNPSLERFFPSQRIDPDAHGARSSLAELKLIAHGAARSGSLVVVLRNPAKPLWFSLGAALPRLAERGETEKRRPVNAPPSAIRGHFLKSQFAR
jgi:hypothetical protein